ncbi:MAG: hypothetical protein EXS29_02620 [Pedosphaera sp.]|nr:hypothetical protein [Pedosphaera sp.]
MTTLFDRLNIRREDRRTVLVAFVVVFLVANAFILPSLYRSWHTVRVAIEQGESRRERLQAQIAKKPAIMADLAQLQKRVELAESAERAELILRQQSELAEKSGLNIESKRPGSRYAGRPGDLLGEETLTLAFTAGDKELLDFLMSTSGERSAVRIRDLDVKPEEPARAKLRGTVTLVASYKKNTSSKIAKPKGKAP